MASGTNPILDDERIFVRVAFETAVRYSYGNGQSGAAHSADVSRGGLCLTMGRYLRPGRLVLLSLPSTGTNEAVELMARVAWCRAENGGQRFRTGVQVIHDEPDSLDEMTRIMHGAVFAASKQTVQVVQRKSLWKRLCCPRGIAASLGVCLSLLPVL